MTNDDNTAIICYVDAEEGQRYWRIDRGGLVLSRKAMDKRIKSHWFVCKGDWIEHDGAAYTWVACQWPSGNIIYRFHESVDTAQ